jgi:hypothetical protein
MFFTLPKNTTKQLKLRDDSSLISRGLAPMSKLASVRKIMLNAQKFSLSLYMGYEPIYRQRGRCQPESGFLLILDLGVLSELYLDFDILLDIGSDLNWESISILPGIGLLIRIDLNSDYDSYFNSTWSKVLIRIS